MYNQICMFMCHKRLLPIAWSNESKELCTLRMYELDRLLRLEGLARQNKEVLLIKKVVQRDVHDLW